MTLHYEHHQMVNDKIRLIIFLEVKDGEALYSQQQQQNNNNKKHNLDLAQILNSLLQNSDLN